MLLLRWCFGSDRTRGFSPLSGLLLAASGPDWNQILQTYFYFQFTEHDFPTIGQAKSSRTPTKSSSMLVELSCFGHFIP